MGKTVSRAGKVLGALGMVATIADGLDGSKGGWKSHHTADLIIGAAMTFGPVGWIGGLTFLAADLITQGVTGKSITENLFDLKLFTLKLVMYNFAFYFFYGALARRNDDTIFTSILGVFIIIGLHLLTILKVLDYFGVISYPTFSSTYLYNKLYWYIPGAVILGVVYLYFNKVKTKAIIEKYSAKDNFYSIGNILLFLLLILIPVLIIVKIK